jgi:hypothetical protein
MDREMQLLLGFQALHHFAKQHQRLPLPRNPQDAEAVVKLTQDLNAQTKQVDKVDEALIKLLAFGASGELAPMVESTLTLTLLTPLDCCTWWYCLTRSAESLFGQVHTRAPTLYL